MMRWEELNRDGFADAVKECEQVCLLPMSAIEPHVLICRSERTCTRDAKCAAGPPKLSLRSYFPITSSGKSTKRRRAWHHRSQRPADTAAT